MPSLKFHIITVVSIFLALALGIFIGSTFTEETIILHQRNTIERMKTDLENMAGEKSLLLAEQNVQASTLSLFQAWLEALSKFYFEANPLEGSAGLIYGEGFDPTVLGEYFNDRVVKFRLKLGNLDAEKAMLLATAIVSGDEAPLHQLTETEALDGSFLCPDYILLAPPLDSEQWTALGTLATTLLNAELPVVALGLDGVTELAALSQHPLFASVSHLDSILGIYCLDAILRGRGGHYGAELLLPEQVGR